ncbi:hypothetical protein GCM10027579_28470 [Calidifontibacter terrae]
MTGPLGYGWLGSKQRETSAEAGGLMLMGVRYYNPFTGAFTSPDPIPGGNDTSYGYPTDPTNSDDVTGNNMCAWFRKACHAVHKYVVDVVAVVPYAAYYYARKLRRSQFVQKSWLRPIWNRSLMWTERRGLLSDMRIDRYKIHHHLGESSAFDEGPGQTIYYNPFHTWTQKHLGWSGPRIRNAPGAYMRHGRAMYDW